MLDYRIRLISKYILRITFDPDDFGLLNLILTAKDESEGYIIDMFITKDREAEYFELNNVNSDLVDTIEFDSEQKRDYFIFILNKRIDMIKKLETLYNNTEVNNGSNNKWF